MVILMVNMKIELKILRARFSLTQKDVANALELNNTASYTRRENGETEFSRSELIKLKKLFELSDSEFIRIFFNGGEEE